MIKRIIPLAAIAGVAAIVIKETNRQYDDIVNGRRTWE